MDSARKIFEQLIGLKQPNISGESSEQRLLTYCSEVLGSVERLHVEFKEKHDRRNGRLADDDKKNLAKAVSGFANSNGGVLIWGIEDKEISPKPISQVAEFVQSLLELAPHLADPSVQGIDGDCIASDEGDGFGIVFIPESLLPPHRVILNNEKTKNHYYTRSGSTFVDATHTQLEDMFGRRPKPSLKLSTRIEAYSNQGNHYLVRVIMSIENQGRGTAKSPFLAVKLHPPYKIHQGGIDGNGSFGLAEMASSSDLNEKKYGASTNIVIHPGVVHAVTVCMVAIDVMHPPEDIPELVIDYGIAAEGMQLVKRKGIVQSSELWAAVNVRT